MAFRRNTLHHYFYKNCFSNTLHVLAQQAFACLALNGFAFGCMRSPTKYMAPPKKKLIIPPIRAETLPTCRRAEQWHVWDWPGHADPLLNQLLRRCAGFLLHPSGLSPFFFLRASGVESILYRLPSADQAPSATSQPSVTRWWTWTKLIL